MVYSYVPNIMGNAGFISSTVRGFGPRVGASGGSGLTGFSGSGVRVCGVGLVG